MKTRITNYAKSIWFKLMNDKLSQHEALALLAIILLLSAIIYAVVKH